MIVTPVSSKKLGSTRGTLCIGMPNMGRCYNNLEFATGTTPHERMFIHVRRFPARLTEYNRLTKGTDLCNVSKQ
ncbi:hypothetical protein GJ496_001195 [Pomphorhynchus laevis]|nr:hypothetical protein GJ496_001195 [Pomphorhynchus laevis]